MAFIEKRCSDVLFHISSTLEHCEIAHGFSTRVGGVSEGDFSSLNLRLGGGVMDTRENLEENYRRFCRAIGADERGVVPAKQVHEDTVRVVSRADAEGGLFAPRSYTADALITNEVGLALTVYSADCGIFLLHDPVTHCIGAVHAGWRGTALGLPSKAVAEMGRLYGAEPRNIRVAVGAGIGPCCFETDEDVPAAMLKAFGSGASKYWKRSGEKWMVDLASINCWQLCEAGVEAEHIDVCGLCTACCSDLYWSHRKMGDRRGVQAAMIALKGADNQ